MGEVQSAVGAGTRGPDSGWGFRGFRPERLSGTEPEWGLRAASSKAWSNEAAWRVWGHGEVECEAARWQGARLEQEGPWEGARGG